MRAVALAHGEGAVTEMDRETIVSAGAIVPALDADVGRTFYDHFQRNGLICRRDLSERAIGELMSL